MMSVLKGFAVGILSFLLFLSLSAFGLAFMLQSTLLDTRFVTAEVDRIDLTALVRDLTEAQIDAELPPDWLFLKEAVYSAISDQEPALKGQLNTAIESGYDYLLGRSQSLSIVVSLEAVKAGLGDSLWQAFKEHLPPFLAAMPEDMLRPLFDQYYQEVAAQIPSKFTVDESVIPAEAMQEISLAREYIGYFQTGYKALIAFMALLAAGIVLIYRNVRDSTRSLGIDLIIYGAVDLAGVYVARHLVPANLSLPGMPPSLQPWLIGLYGDVLAPLQALSLGILIGGAVLLAVSFLYRPRATED